MQARLKRRIFFSSLEKKFKANCLLPMVRKLVRVPLPLPYIQKIVKNANGDLRRIKIKIIIELAGMLMNGHPLEEILISRNTLIFLVQHLGFVINWKKSVLKPVQETVLGLKTNLSL